MRIWRSASSLLLIKVVGEQETQRSHIDNPCLTVVWYHMHSKEQRWKYLECLLLGLPNFEMMPALIADVLVEDWPWKNACVVKNLLAFVCVCVMSEWKTGNFITPSDLASLQVDKMSHEHKRERIEDVRRLKWYLFTPTWKEIEEWEVVMKNTVN